MDQVSPVGGGASWCPGSSFLWVKKSFVKEIMEISLFFFFFQNFVHIWVFSLRGIWVEKRAQILYFSMWLTRCLSLLRML